MSQVLSQLSVYGFLSIFYENLSLFKVEIMAWFYVRTVGNTNFNLSVTNFQFSVFHLKVVAKKFRSFPFKRYSSFKLKVSTMILSAHEN